MKRLINVTLWQAMHGIHHHYQEHRHTSCGGLDSQHPPLWSLTHNYFSAVRKKKKKKKKPKSPLVQLSSIKKPKGFSGYKKKKHSSLIKSNTHKRLHFSFKFFQWLDTYNEKPTSAKLHIKSKVDKILKRKEIVILQQKPRTPSCLPMWPGTNLHSAISTGFLSFFFFNETFPVSRLLLLNFNIKSKDKDNWRTELNWTGKWGETVILWHKQDAIMVNSMTRV